MLSAAHAGEEPIGKSENAIDTKTHSLLGWLVVPKHFIENLLLFLLQFLFAIDG
jgi:hypothetical protein